MLASPGVTRADTLCPASRSIVQVSVSLPVVSVVVPAKDEAANIGEILPYLDQYYEVVVVVSDDDEESAEAARTALPTAKIVVQTRKGKGNALVCGFAQATGDIIVFDSDASNLDPGDGNSSADVFVGIEASVLYALFADGFE